MTLDVTGDRVRIIGASGEATFDTNSRHMLITDFKTGTFPIVAIQAGRNFSQTETPRYYLGPINSRANFVTGYHIDVFGEVQPIGGTQFLFLANDLMAPDDYAATGGENLTSTTVFYEFTAEAGRLYVTVGYRFPKFSDFGIVAQNLQYWAFCGTFDY